jgi:hypothetical protein
MKECQKLAVIIARDNQTLHKISPLNYNTVQLSISLFSLCRASCYKSGNRKGALASLRGSPLMGETPKTALPCLCGTLRVLRWRTRRVAALRLR